MSDFKLVYKLKQHTPIIHFQGKERGATLRATELKPKLDKFLIAYFKGKNIEYNNFLLPEQTEALNYKVNIQTVGTKSHPIDLQQRNNGQAKFKEKNGEKIPVMNPFPSFFATMGDTWKNDKKYFTNSINITLTIKVLNKELKEYIKENLPSFLAYTNFGTRQSKGFGSFYIDKEDKVNYVDIAKVFNREKCWSFDISTNEKMKDKVMHYYPLYGESYSVFSKIELLYKTLRSGINIKNRDEKTIFYFKSLLYQYMNECTDYEVWDKAVIKSKFLDGEDISRKKILSRDLLGLSTIHEYRKLSTIHEYRDKSFTVRHPRSSDSNYKENDVERFKSPIIFKPIKVDKDTFRIFVTTRPQSVYKALEKQEILILKEKDRAITDTVTIKLLEDEKDFNLVDFLQTAFSTNIESHILKYQKNTDADYLSYKVDSKDSISLSKSIALMFNSIKEVS